MHEFTNFEDLPLCPVCGGSMRAEAERLYGQCDLCECLALQLPVLMEEDA